MGTTRDLGAGSYWDHRQSPIEDRPGLSPPIEATKPLVVVRNAFIHGSDPTEGPRSPAPG